MISLEHLLLDPEVLQAKFACDVVTCKGACCTMPGGAGAPLEVGELAEIENCYEAVKEYLPAKSRAHIEKHGMFESNGGKYFTNCIDGNDCVFVVYEKGVAACSIEKAWHDGKSDFRKPISCHLFPIRVAHFGGPYLHYQQFDECAPGRELGKLAGVPLVVGLRDAIERAYGTEIADQMVQAASTEKIKVEGI
ncbi:MAG: DUF3109 family protein [Ignavibacteria bacterium]|nr:DUF3109 family protein [Ignavibacteria bacterium]